nr:hypothetical protein [uncultured Mediterranean phage uvMED]
MSSQLNVDTIVDKAGSGGSNVKMANTSTYVSDGGGATQNTVQGLAKAWFQASSDTTLGDSFNISSGTDNGTGDYSYALSNAFANDDYADNYTVYTTVSRFAIRNDGRDATDVLATEVFNSSSNADHAHLGSAHGDLA